MSAKLGLVTVDLVDVLLQSQIDLLTRGEIAKVVHKIDVVGLELGTLDSLLFVVAIISQSLLVRVIHAIDDMHVYRGGPMDDALHEVVSETNVKDFLWLIFDWVLFTGNVEIQSVSLLVHGYASSMERVTG